MKRRDCKQAITKLDGYSTAKPNAGRYSIRIPLPPAAQPQPHSAMESAVTATSSKRRLSLGRLPAA